MAEIDGFVEAMMRSPVGVALLARLESRVDDPQLARAVVLDTLPLRVAAAADAMASMTLGELLDLAVLAGVIDVGPWISDAGRSVATASRHAVARAPIAEAVAGRFGAELHRPVDFGVQQWWTTAHPWFERRSPLFEHFEDVYGAGQFTLAGLWTVSDPPAVAHQQIAGAWELEDSAVSRWHLPVLDRARVYEVHRPADWVGLVTRHPRPADPRQEGWELPGGNQRLEQLGSLLRVPDQHAARDVIGRHLVPDWRSVAEEYDGVHLSWAGFITSEGYVSDLDAGVRTGDVAMLRYWFTERTLWLADVFGEPQPRRGPALSDRSAPGSVDVTTDESRRRRDQRVLTRLLRR